MRRRRLFAVLTLTLMTLAVFAGEPSDYYEIKKTTLKLDFDGICNEELWKELKPLSMSMFRPDHGGTPTQRSEVYITHDDMYFYLGAKLYYSGKARPVVTTKRRDGADGGSDNFGILLDTFDDNENALCFETNPSGMRSDFTISNDGQTNQGKLPFNRSWNTFWDVKTNVTDTLWQVEMRIPVSSLRFQIREGKVIMGMSIWRSIVSIQEWQVFPLMSNAFGIFSIWKPSQARKVVVYGLKKKNPVYLTPYGLAGLEQNSELNEDGTAYKYKLTHKLNAGLDVKYSLTSNITLDLTFNTDFAQVEADDQLVNLTRFSLFYPEKRQFFIERSSIFTLRTGYLDQLFYSRRIGLYEGEVVPILAGARMVGRVGNWDLGFMDMQTASIDYKDVEADTSYKVPSTNYGVLRVRKSIINPRSYVGGMVTSKIDVDGGYNVNTAVDMIYNPFRNDYITFNYGQTFDDGVDPDKDFFDHGKLFFNWQNRSNVGFNYDFILSRAGKYYNPEMGFEMMDDYSRVFGLIGYGWVYNERKKKMLSRQVYAWTWLNKQNKDMKTDILKSQLGYTFSMKSGFVYRFEFENSYEYLEDPFSISDDMMFPAGEYLYQTLNAGIRTPSNKLFSFRAALLGGTYYDGTIVTFGPAEVTMRASSTLKLGLDYQFNHISVASRNQYFTSHLARLRTELTFTTKLSLLVFFQYSSSDLFGINNIRFRYNPREGNDLYLVYNGSYNTSLQREFPALPPVDANTFIVKYTYTFIWGK